MRINIDWDKVDWTMADADIALILECTREAVRQQRPKNIKKSLPFANHCNFSYAVKICKSIKLIKLIEEAKYMDNNKPWVGYMNFYSKNTGIPPTSLNRYLYELKYTGIIKLKKDWQDYVNWDLPNADLQEIWGHCNVGNLRVKYDIKPKWSKRGGGLLKCETYFKMLKNEKLKKKWWDNTPWLSLTDKGKKAYKIIIREGIGEGLGVIGK